MGIITKETTVDGIKPIGSNLFGTCSTASATVAKVVTMPDFDVLVSGVTIHVQFTNANTAKSPTLKVGSTSAVPIQRNGASEGVWENGSVISFTYNGTHWVQNDADKGDGGTTYGLSYDDATGELSLVEGGGSDSVIISVNDTTYTMSISGHTLTLTSSSGTTQSITIPDDDTTYTLGTANDKLWLRGSDGVNSSVDLPHLVKNLETITHSLYVNLDGLGYEYAEDNYVTNNYGYEYLAHSDDVYIVDESGNDITGISEYDLNHIWTTSEARTFGQNLFNYFASHNGYRLKINGVLTQKIKRSGWSGTQSLTDFDTVIARTWGHDGIDDFGVFVEGVVLGQKNTIELHNMDGTVDAIELKAIDIGALPASQYQANDKGHDGYVVAPGSINANRVWKTDEDGNPDWRVDEGTTYTLTKSGNTITLTGSDGSVSTITDANTTYGLAFVNGQLSLVEGGQSASVQIPDDDTTYTLSISGNVITLTGSDGSTSSVTVPGGGGSDHVELTQAEYDALPQSEKENDDVYFITDADPTPTELIDLFYPVGSYYETSEALFDPNVSWGGTWVKDSNVPYVVEQGTSGIWTYKKWSDGTAECWGTSPTRTVTSWSAWGGLYYGNPYNVQDNYPSGLFVSVPNCQASLASVSYDMFLVMTQSVSGTASKTPAFYPARGTTGLARNTYRIAYHAIGKWRNTAEYIQRWHRTA